jgi:thiamine kinase-like enzyme
VAPDFFSDVIQYFQLGALLAEPLRVQGGLLHRMWRIETTQGVYALKQLSSHVGLDQPGVQARYEGTEQVAAEFAAAGIPALGAIGMGGRYLFAGAGQFFLVYPWVEGVMLSTETISAPHALEIAAVLARVHALNLKQLSLDMPHPEVYTADQVRQFIQQAQEQACPFAADLLDHQEELIVMNQAYAEAVPVLQGHLLISHGDLDQKNVLWQGQHQPILLDWESAGWINPLYDLVNTSLYWSGMTTEQFDPELFFKMIANYRQYGGVIHGAHWQAAFAGVYSWINWMMYSIRQACKPGSSEHKTLALQQVPQTLAAMLRLRKWMPELLAKTACCSAYGLV